MMPQWHSARTPGDGLAGAGRDHVIGSARAWWVDAISRTRICRHRSRLMPYWSASCCRVAPDSRCLSMRRFRRASSGGTVWYLDLRMARTVAHENNFRNPLDKLAARADSRTVPSGA